MALGAAVGVAIGGKLLGRKAAVVGAFIALLPDLDVAAQPFLSSAASMLFHRGITHSFFVWLIVSPLIGYLIWRFYRNTPMLKWILISLSAWFSHILIDGFNSYGTAWFLPFSNYRVAIGSIAVVDIFFTLPLLLFLVVLVLKRDMVIVKLARGLLVYTGFYIGLSLLLQHHVEVRAAQAFVDRNIVVSNVKAYASPFSLLVWQVEGETDSAFVMANQGVLKSNPEEFYSFKKQWKLLRPFTRNADVASAIQFTQGRYIVSQRSDSLFLSDLRLAPLVITDANTQFVVSFPITNKGGSIQVGTAYPKRHFSKKAFNKWVQVAF